MSSFSVTGVIFAFVLLAGCGRPLPSGVFAPSGKFDLSPATGADSAQMVKVLSLNFNAEASIRDSGEKLRRLRFERYLDWIKKNDPDIILVSEGYEVFGDPSVAVSLARSLDYDVAYRIVVGFVGVTYYSDAVIAKKKFHMTDEQDVELPHSAFSFGDGKHWLAAFGPISYGVGAKLTLENGEPLYTYATHLLGDTEQDRFDQGLALNEAIRKQVFLNGGSWSSAKVILGGDFNDGKEGTLERFLVADGYQESWDQAHPGDPGFTNYTDPSKPLFNPVSTSAGLIPMQSGMDHVKIDRPDHIFTRGDSQRTVASTVVFTSPVQGIWMSDHYGLFSTIAMNGDAPKDVPNPLNDLVEMPPSALLTVNEKMFDCGFFIDHKCHLKLGIQDVDGPRGVTIHNLPGTGAMDIDIDETAGWIYTASHVHVQDNNWATFIFTKTGDYPYVLWDNYGNTIEGLFRVKGI